MKNSIAIKAVTTITLVASFVTTNASVANAGGPFTPPGMELCMNPGGCPLPPAGGGGIIMPPPGPGPGGGGGGGGGGAGGGGGGFGKGLGAGIGLGIGLGIANAMTRPKTVIVQQPTHVQPVQGISAHDQYCLGKYKSYNINTKQYLSYSGVYKYCRSPYM